MFIFVLDIADIAMGDMTDTQKKVVENSGVAIIALSFPIGGCDLFIAYLLVHVLVVLVMFIDALVLCLVHAHMF